MTAQHFGLMREILWERDKGICYLCGGDIPSSRPSIPYRTVDMTIDHVEPQSLGGDNSLDNLRATHRLCNNMKGDGPVPEELYPVPEDRPMSKKVQKAKTSGYPYVFGMKRNGVHRSACTRISCEGCK